MAPTLFLASLLIIGLIYVKYPRALSAKTQDATEKAKIADNQSPITSSSNPNLAQASNSAAPAPVAPAAPVATNLPKNAKVNFVSPKDGATVTQKFKVAFTVDGLKVEKAGVAKTGTGHYNLIIDSSPTPAGQIVERDRSHLHFDDGQSDSEINLPPGKHTLSLQFADGTQVSYGAALSKSITVEVK